jgi:predicted RNase H-like nuclease
MDLAWGSLDPEKKPNRTGVAVLDETGCLTFVDSAIADADILNALAPYVGGPCVVAIDAPLLVTNQKGKRQAETGINGIFRGFDAGAHSANIERFSANPRGARMASAMDLDIDPASTSPRRAIEGFPHPATVALCRLGRIFKYKKGTPDERRPEFIN